MNHPPLPQCNRLLERPPSRSKAAPLQRSAPLPRASDSIGQATLPSRVRTRILIVEDDPGLQRALCKHFANTHVDVAIASHYSAVRAHFESTTPDLVCVDLGLPTESGYEVCEFIRGLLGLESPPILVTSEFGSPQERAYAEEAGASAFLVKPFSMLLFAERVGELLEQARASRGRVVSLGLGRAASRPQDRVVSHVRRTAAGVTPMARPIHP